MLHQMCLACLVYQSILKFPGELALLGAWVVVTTAVALRVFKFT